MDPETKGLKYEWLYLPLEDSASSPLNSRHDTVGGHGLQKRHTLARGCRKGPAEL